MKMKYTYILSSKNSKEGDQFGEPGINEMIILKWVLKVICKAVLELTGLRWGPMLCFCEQELNIRFP
jgi:hypothetical protein